MNIPYQSIYDEAISDRVLQKVGRSKFSSLGNAPAKNELDQAIIDTMMDDISTLKNEISVLLKNMRKEFKGLEKDSLKLRLKNSSYYKSFKQSLWATNISSSYSDNIADVKFPGKFGKTIDVLQKKVLELNNIFNSRDYTTYKDKLPKDMESSILWKGLNLDNSDTGFDKGIEQSMRLGITPANYGGFYRMHMTNPPPDAFKSSTRGIGIGKYLYLALIHHCGHGFTESSSDDALKVWSHIVKKRTDIYSFMAQDEIGSGEVLAISIRVPKKDVLEILNKWIETKSNISDTQYKSFFGWLKYRNTKYNDLPIDLLDDGLYDLFKKEIEALNFTEKNVETNSEFKYQFDNEKKSKKEQEKMYGEKLLTKDEILKDEKNIIKFINNLPESNTKTRIVFWTKDNYLMTYDTHYKDLNPSLYPKNEYEIESEHYSLYDKTKSNTKPSNKPSKIIIEKTKITYDEAKRKYGDTFLTEKQLIQNKNEFIEFFKDVNNHSLANQSGYFVFWTSESDENYYRVASYGIYNYEFYFDWIPKYSNNNSKYYLVHFKNKPSNTTSQGFGKGNRATSNTRSASGGKLVNNYRIVDEKWSYIQHKIMYEDYIFNKASLGEDSSLHSSFNEAIKNLVEQNKPTLENGKFVFWCEDGYLPCIAKYYIKGNYISYTTLSSNSRLIYNQYNCVVKNF